MPSEAFKREDLFVCRKCGDCCRGYGGTFVDETDIEAIARYMDVDRRQFVTKFCQISGSRPVLAQGANGYCIFWDQLCRIHPVKPRMCKAWPFIASVLIDPHNWDIMAASCPGMRTDVPASVIRDWIEKGLAESA
ncbi:MAG: YkgJ family cysteine cluster protein [Desulfobacterales bacterium]|nr:MAG: YkgJ family cysteine cluster protein [Desulfobacterales bacterium]